METDPSSAPDRDGGVSAARHVNRAIAELRRGAPVLLEGTAPLLLLAAETSGPDSLDEFRSLGDGPFTLLFSPERGAAVLRQPISGDALVAAASLPAGLVEPDRLASLADPTRRQGSSEGITAVTPPPGAAAAIALAKLGQLLPVVLATPPAPQARSAECGVARVTADEVMGYRAREALNLRIVATAPVPLALAGDARVMVFRSEGSAVEHLAIVIGQPEGADAPLVRVHSSCLTGDLLGSMRCDCGDQLRGAIQRIAEYGNGVVLYLAQEGRGIGLANKLRAYVLQNAGLDTFDANRVLGWDADERNFLVAATMLRALGISRIRLLTNNPDKIASLTACGIEVSGREPHTFTPNPVNVEYLATKAVRFGHLLD